MPLIRKDALPPNAKASPVAGLSSVSPDERWAAARQTSGPEDVGALASALLQEPDPRVREALLTSLGRIGTEESAAAVLPLLRSDDAAARTGALDALRAMPKGAARLLPALLADSDADVRLLATELARGIPPGEAGRLLCELLDREESANVCAAAVEVLTEVGDASTAPSLEGCARRHPGEPFLAFAIQVALQRVQAQAPPQ